MKLWERVIKRWLRIDISISENQFEFMPDRLTTEEIHLTRKLMEMYQDKNKILTWSE